jgi:cell division septum initiation protein DivIVA
MGNKQGKQRKRAATTSAASSHSQPKFKAIADNYQSLGEVQQALRDAGLESSNCKRDQNKKRNSFYFL